MIIKTGSQYHITKLKGIFRFQLFKVLRYMYHVHPILNYTFPLFFSFVNVLMSVNSFFCGILVLVSWQAFISSIVLKLYFISQLSSKSTLPFAGLQHMQQCQVNFHSIFASIFDPNEWCLKNGLHSEGLNPQPLSHESSALTTRPQPLACQ